MYSSVSKFIEDWQNEAALTVKIFEAIPEEKLNEIPGDNIRTLARMAWHITCTTVEMPFNAGLLKEEVINEDEVPSNIADITEQFKKYSNELVEVVQKEWGEADLQETLQLYGQTWTKNLVLTVLVKHMIHHRAQMTVVMRILGIRVPGIYGPSKEEWAEFGLDSRE